MLDVVLSPALVESGLNQVEFGFVGTYDTFEEHHAAALADFE